MSTNKQQPALKNYSKSILISTDSSIIRLIRPVIPQVSCHAGEDPERDQSASATLHFPLTFSYLMLMLLLRAGRPIYAKGNHFPPPRLSISSSHIFIATADRTTSIRSDGAAAHHHRQAALRSLS